MIENVELNGTGLHYVHVRNYWQLQSLPVLEWALD